MIQTHRTAVALVIPVISALVLTGCTATKSPTNTTVSAPDGPAVSQIEIEEAPMEVTELKITDKQPGVGQAVQEGDTVTVHYTGALPDGTVFNDSRQMGRTFSFTVGAGEVIPAWEQGVVGMQVDGVRELVVPPAMAYGSQGVPGVIPPNSPLIFEIELLEIDGSNTESE